MLTVHHLNNSRSQRVLWLLEELGVAYDIVRYQRQADMRAPPELRAIHPLGKSPVITDDGKTIAESGAIAEYLIGTYGNGRLIPPLKLHMAFWESELSKGEWFAGEAFTAVDIQMSFPLEAAAARGGLQRGYPKTMAFLERIHARPAYQHALEKGGPYQVGR